MNILELHYQRLHEFNIDGEYPYTGFFRVDKHEMHFASASFKELVHTMHKLLVDTDAIKRVILQRTERDDVRPFELGPTTFDLLKTDPAAAYAAMTMPIDTQVSGAGAGDTFGRQVYLRVANGQIEDPLTGKWLTLAYGTKQGWKIRGEGNASSEWLSLSAVVDDAPEGTKTIERLIYMRWALIDVEELLKKSSDRFYLPRAWNKNGPWITREELVALYEKSKENAS